MFNKFCKKLATFFIDSVMALTSEFTGVSLMSIHIRKEKSIIDGVSSPVEKRNCIRKVLDVTCDEFVRFAMCYKIHPFYANNELLALKKVLTAITIDPILPNLKRSSLYNLLKELYFEFIPVRRNRKNIIVDGDDIVV